MHPSMAVAPNRTEIYEHPQSVMVAALALIPMENPEALVVRSKDRGE